ncbi:MAG: rod shape-determining protein MreC [Ignavibacteriales bacterium]|nr:rod shape-determining protein MreC [Ignavibacteriales bacterium]
MHRLYRLYLSFKEYVIFWGLVIVSLILLSMNDNPQIRMIRSITISSVGAFQSAFSFLPNFFSLQAENDGLRRINVALADEVNQLREARLENIRLRSMVALKESCTTKLVPGKVVGKNLTLLRNTVTLSVGTDDGLSVGMPVVTGEGLVGKIIAASGGYSIIQILLNVDFRASAKVQRSRVDGILAWDGKVVLLKNVPKSLDVRPGDAVITSEYSNAFPAGIKIGVVASVRELPNNLFTHIEIMPSVDFTRMEETFVLSYLPSLEKFKLEEKHQK